MYAWSARWPNLRCRQWQDGEAGLRKGKQWATANFQKGFIPYWRCCITKASTANANYKLWQQVFIRRLETATQNISRRRTLMQWVHATTQWSLKRKVKLQHVDLINSVHNTCLKRPKYGTVVQPTMSCFADWSKCRHVTLSIIECRTIHDNQ